VLGKLQFAVVLPHMSASMIKGKRSTNPDRPYALYQCSSYLAITCSGMTQMSATLHAFTSTSIAAPLNMPRSTPSAGTSGASSREYELPEGSVGFTEVYCTSPQGLAVIRTTADPNQEIRPYARYHAPFWNVNAPSPVARMH
jgi:hypothetical protein